MPSTGEQVPQQRRQRPGQDPLVDHSSESRPFKRLKSTIRLHSTAFYHSLSKSLLTRRALKELDRRTGQDHCFQRSVSSFQPIYQGDTSTQIQRFARHGGPELRDLRGYPPPTDADLAYIMSSCHSDCSSHSSGSKRSKPTILTSASSKTRRSSAYDNNFEQHLIDNNIFPKGYEHPNNRQTPEPVLDGLHQRLAQPRPSLSPSQFTSSHFRAFERANDRVISEGKVMSAILPVIHGKSNISNEGDLVFTRLDPIADNTIVDAKPDFYDGARLEDLDKEVQGDLKKFIIPTGYAKAPVAPNFFLEVKAPKGGADVAKRQACYNGALGARAMHQLQSYKQEPVYDGEAYTISSTYHDGTLKIYTTHPTEGPDGLTEYHMTQVDTWALTGNVNSFRKGAAAFRNARDWAQEKRDMFISDANATARSVYTKPSHVTSCDENDGRDLPEIRDAGQVSQAEDTNADSNSRCFMSHHLSDISQTQLSRSSSNLESSDYHGNSDTTVAHLLESETSADELALDTPTALNKRRHKTSKTESCKALRRRGTSERRYHRGQI